MRQWSRENLSSLLHCLGESFKNQLIAVASIIQGAVHAADGGCRCTGFFCNFEIGSVVAQHGGDFKAL